MEAKDTLIHIEDLIEGRLPRTYVEMRDNLLKQAEITWPVAEQAGARKVVEKFLTDDSLEIGRKAIEDTLIDFRDSRISQFPRGNGLVVREKDGQESDVIRFGPETALKIGIEAMWQAFVKSLEVK